jgi:hypothetical protein
MSRELPRVEVKPVIWDFDLVAIHDFLLEDTIAVAETVTPSGVVQRCKTVKKAGGETTKTAVA